MERTTPSMRQVFPDGFYKNEAIKIVLPSKLQAMEKGLRAAGMSGKLDELELSMNRAAEKAAPEARTIFKDAVTSMSIEDARKILTGANTAATDHFKAKTTNQLTSAFRPAVETSMESTGVIQQYKSWAGQMPSMPFGGGKSFDITEYVVSKALAGLLYMVGQEEARIRKNPEAQVTPLLKQVFGH